MNQHPIPKPLPTGGKGGSIDFWFSSAVGAQLGLFLVLGLEEGRWTSSPVPEPFCASAWSCAWIPTPDSRCLGWHQESVSLQYHVGGLDLIPSAVFSFPKLAEDGSAVQTALLVAAMGSIPRSCLLLLRMRKICL